MAIESKERRIGATTYRITQLPAKRGRAMIVRLVRLLGPGAGAFVGGVGRGGAGGRGFDTALGIGLGDAIIDVATRINDEDLGAICDEFATYTVVVQSREIELQLSKVFDDHFAGKYDEMLEWLRACAEVNFTSFFGASSSAGGLLARLMALASKLPSPTASTGTSTASPPAADTPMS